MRRGEIRLVDLEPAPRAESGAESGKRRPAVVVSNEKANATAVSLGRGVLTVVPVTSNVDRIYPFQVLLRASDTGLQQDSKAQAEQVRSVAIERIGHRMGTVPPPVLRELDQALRIHLAL